MKQIWSVAKLTFFLPFRRKGGWVLCGLVAAIAVFMFLVSRSDGTLINELRLRIRFALYFSTTLLSLVLLWYACLSMRGDIESKRMHMLSAYPIHRAKVYIGKWLGLLMFGGVGLVSVCVTTAVCAIVTVQTWDKAEHVREVMSDYVPVSRQAVPVIPDATDLARLEMREMKLRGQYPQNKTEQEVLEICRKDIIRRQQLVRRNAVRPWQFELGRRPPEDTEIVVHYRFYAHDRDPVRIRWSIAVTDDGDNYFEMDAKAVSAKPSRTNEIRFPARHVRPNGKVRIIFTGVNNPDVVFMVTNGMRISYQDGSWGRNLCSFAIAMLAHFGVVVAAGLTFATAFTLSVASFVSMVVYFLALASDFFVSFLREIKVDVDAGLFESLGGIVIRIGLFFATGLEPPTAIYPLSEAVLITPANLGMQITRQAGSLLLTPIKVFSDAAYNSVLASGWDLFCGYTIYIAIIAVLGMWLLKRKELDRVH